MHRAQMAIDNFTVYYNNKKIYRSVFLLYLVSIIIVCTHCDIDIIQCHI